MARRARPLAHLLAPGVTRELLVLAQKRERNSEISCRRARIPSPPPRPDEEAAPTAKGGGGTANTLNGVRALPRTLRRKAHVENVTLTTLSSVLGPYLALA